MMKLNEEHLGSMGTETEARSLVSRLCALGYDVEYGAPTHADATLNDIPDDVWRRELDAVLAAESAQAERADLLAALREALAEMDRLSRAQISVPESPAAILRAAIARATEGK